jgi:hypothetical protein
MANNKRPSSLSHFDVTSCDSTYGNSSSEPSAPTAGSTRNHTSVGPNVFTNSRVSHMNPSGRMLRSFSGQLRSRIAHIDSSYQNEIL